VPQALGIKNLAELMRANLYSIDPEYLPKGVKRSYIYLEADAVILANDVEKPRSRCKRPEG